MAQRLAEAVPAVAGVDEAHVLLWEPGDALLARAASTAQPLLAPAERGPTAVQNVDLANRMLEMSTPTVVGSTSDPILCSIVALTGLAQGVLVPITARNTLFGVLVVGSDALELRPDEALWERLSGAASLAATALDGVALLEEVRHQALHDPVTDLANSRLFEDRVTQSLSIARRNSNRLALLFVDLDRFKLVNDSHGHKVGDELLRAVAERLLLTVREEDTVARIGGDEFGILLQGMTHTSHAEGVAAEVVGALGEPFVVRGLSLSIGASVGVTVFPQGGDTYDSIVSRADSAMYRAKADGRGRFKTHGPTSTSEQGRARA